MTGLLWVRNSISLSQFVQCWNLHIKMQCTTATYDGMCRRLSVSVNWFVLKPAWFRKLLNSVLPTPPACKHICQPFSKFPTQKDIYVLTSWDMPLVRLWWTSVVTILLCDHTTLQCLVGNQGCFSIKCCVDVKPPETQNDHCHTTSMGLTKRITQIWEFGGSCQEFPSYE